MAYQEADLIKTLPVDRPREWLLTTHLPHLLSYRVAEDQNLVTYAISLAKAADQNKQPELAKAAAQLCMDLVECGKAFEGVSRELDDQENGGYNVLMPKATAVSILI